MALDLSAYLGLEEKPPKIDFKKRKEKAGENIPGKYKNVIGAILERNKTEEKPDEEQEAKRKAANELKKLKREVERCQRENKEIRENYTENKTKAQRLELEILHGIEEGEYPQVLLMKACRAIGCLTNSTDFYSQVQQDIINVYGGVLQDQGARKAELDDLEDRLAIMKRALNRMNSETEYKRLTKIIFEHERKATRLAAELAEAPAQ